jgi:hypothetical protein
MKNDWERTTRVCATIDLRPDLLAAIRDYVELHELGATEAQALVCFENVSRRAKKPSLMERLGGAGHKTMTQAVIVTATRLLWAQRSDDEEAFARSELLGGLEVTDYEKGPGFELLPDHGVEVFGIRAGEGRVGTLFFGMGEGPDADKARMVLKDAVRAAHGEGPPVGGGASG